MEMSAGYDIAQTCREIKLKRGAEHLEQDEDEKVVKKPSAPQYNFTRYCYRHNPDIQASATHRECMKQDLECQKAWEAKVKDLGTEEERDQVMKTVAEYESGNDKLRKLMLEGILLKSCFPQLSYISCQAQKLIRIDFVSALPEEISLKILRYLDCQSLCSAAAVCRRWKELADGDSVWYHMCEQHIDRKCPQCGWGLPLLHMKRARYVEGCDEVQHIKGQKRNDKAVVPKMRPWKVVYRERFKVENNWRKGLCDIQEFKGHMDGVLSLQFICSLLFTGSYDSTVAIWDLSTGRMIRRLTGHTDGVKSLRFDDQKLITGSLDKTIRVWNYVTGACISTYRGHQDSVLSVDSYKKMIVSGSADKTVKVWHVESRTCYTLRGHTEWVNCVKLHPKSFTCFSCSDDTTIRMWDIRTNTCIKVFRGHVAQVQKVIPLTYMGEDLVQEPHDTTMPMNETTTEQDPTVQPSNWDDSLPYPTHLLSCSLDNTIKLWDVKTGKCIRTQFGHFEGVWDIAADNFRIVSGSHDRTCKIWDLQSGKCMHTFTGNQAPVVCVGIGDSEFVSGDELGCVRMHSFGSPF